MGRLAVTGIEESEWRFYATRVPADRLMLAVLSLYSPIPRRLLRIRAVLTAVLVARSGELQGIKSELSMRHGEVFWGLARVGLVGTEVVRRWKGPTADY